MDDNAHYKLVLHDANSNDDTIVIWCTTHGGPKADCKCP